MEKLSHGDIEETSRGHELYLRHLLLLLKAAPLALKGYIYRKVGDCNGDLVDLIIENKDIFYTNYREEFEQLFLGDKVNDKIDSWDTRLRCIVISVLFHSKSDLQRTEFEAVKCILDQRNDLDNYVQSASLDYNTFQIKWTSLHEAIIELIKELDDASQFECKRMIHSYTPQSICICSQTIKLMKGTLDVNTHVTIALQNKVDQEDGNPGIYDQDQLEKRKNENTKFNETLQDKFVYAGDSAILTCKLNTSEEAVKWRHDNKQIEQSETLKIFKDENCHWLAISCARLEDAGQYSCVCCKASTTAYLRVLDKPPLKIKKELHVATKETNIRENMNLDLVCEVNQHTANVTWRHKGGVIDCERHHVSFNGNVHKLTIRNAQYEDEGEYTVDFVNTKSNTQVTLTENPNHEYRAQQTKFLFNYWIRSVLGLKYLKLGLENVSNCIVTMHLEKLKKQCTVELNPAHEPKFCSKKKCFCMELKENMKKDHRSGNIQLNNTEVQKLIELDPWSVAKCYINTPGYKDKPSVKEIDCAGILSLFINNTFFVKVLNGIEVNVFKKAKDTRNAILHNANYELPEDDFNEYLNIFISVLKVQDMNGKYVVLDYSGSKEARDKLDELWNDDIDISTTGELEKQIQEMKDQGMTEDAKKIEEATKQYRIKQQLLEERLTEREKELQLMRDLRSSKQNENDTTVIFNIDLHLQVIEQTGNTSTQGNEIITDYQNGQKMKANQHTSQTESSVQRLLGQIKGLENCRIVGISSSQTATVVKITCFTCKAIYSFLKLINGNQFQKEIMELRKCLKMHEHLNIFDVLVNCSPASLENARKSLSKQVQIKNFTCENHQGTQCTWYCPDHDEFFCTACKDLDHSACIGLKQVISERSYREQKQSLICQDEIKKYKVRKKNLFKRSEDCGITSIRMIPNSEILLVDAKNNRLKKLDRTYTIVSHCDIPHTPFGVCYIGNDRAAVSLGLNGIKFVNVSDKMKLEHTVNLDHCCFSLACHGESLYIGDGCNIYRYNKDCQHKRVLYTYQDDINFDMTDRIAVSDDGERIYIIDGHNGLIIIDKEGKQLSTLTGGMGLISDVCVVGDGTVLVVDISGGVYQVDYRVEKVLGTVISPISGLRSIRSLCFDRSNCKLLVSRKDNNSITAYPFKMQSTC